MGKGWGKQARSTRKVEKEVGHENQGVEDRWGQLSEKRTSPPKVPPSHAHESPAPTLVLSIAPMPGGSGPHAHTLTEPRPPPRYARVNRVLCVA